MTLTPQEAWRPHRVKSSPPRSRQVRHRRLFQTFVGLFIYLFLILGLPPFSLLAMSATQRIGSFVTHRDLGWFESLQHRGSAAFSSYLLQIFVRESWWDFFVVFIIPLIFAYVTLFSIYLFASFLSP